MALTRPKFAQFDTTITSITDPQLVLNRNSTLANVDIGFVFNRDGGSSANAAVIWQESSLSFVLATTSNSGVTNSNIALTDYANLKVSNLVANSGVYTDNLFFANGSPYLVGGGSGTVNYDASPTPPGSPQVGDFWYDTSEDILFQYTDDGVNNVWIDLSGSPVLDILNTANVISGNVYTDNLFYANGQPWQFGAGLPDKISSASSNVTVTSGYVNIAIASSNVVSVGSNVEISANLLPSANITYDLGSASQRWRTLYLSGSTIDLGGALISYDASGFTFTAPSGSPVTLASNGSVSGTLLTNSQPNITSVGTLTSLNVTGNANVGNVVTDGYYYANGTNVIGTINSSIVTANTAMKSYVDSSTASNIATANTALKSYVDSIDSTKANIANPSFTGTVTAPNIAVTSNLSVVGDFTVTGTTTTLNTENLSINDPLIYLGEDNTFDLVDIGLVGSYTRDSVYRHTGVIRDASDQTWKFFDNVIAEPTAVIDLGGATYSSVLLGNLETTGNAVIGANIRLSGRLQDASGVGGTSGQYLTSTGTGIGWTTIDISTDSITDASLVSNVTAYAESVNVIVNTSSVANFTSTGLLLSSGSLTFGSSGKIKIGPNTGLTNQGSLAVAIGEDAGRINQGYAGIGIGYNAGNWYQGEVAVAIGYGAGQDAQGIYSVAVGDLAGQIYQGNNAVSLGYAAGQNYQGNISIAIGSEAGRYNQLGNAVAIGTFAGRTDQATYTVAIGNRAGNTSQQFGAVAIGYDAGRTSQGSTAVAVGTDAGRDNQRDEAVAVGIGAGQYNQLDAAVAIGSLAGNNNQGISAVAIGELAATSNQGNAAIAIGSRAGYTSQHDNSIVLNATGSNLNSPAASSFTVKPVRATQSTGNLLAYSASTGEITYSNVTVTSAGNVAIGSVSISANLIHTINNPNVYGTSENDSFGGAVDADGDLMIVSAQYEVDSTTTNTGSGAAYIIRISTGQVLYSLVNPNAFGTPTSDWFGTSVAISGNLAVVGASGEDSGSGQRSGKAYVYNISTFTSNVITTANYTLNNPNAYSTETQDQFGTAVGISGNLVVVSAANESDAGGSSSGKVYVYNIATFASNVINTATYTINNPNAYGSSGFDFFGINLDIDGNNIIVCSSDADASGGSSGKVYVFDVSTFASNTISTANYTINNPNAYGTGTGDRFGRELAINGNYIIASAYDEDDAGIFDSGKVYIFDTRTFTSNTISTATYTINNPNVFGTADDDAFGSALAFDGELLVVTAVNESSGNGVVYAYNISTFNSNVISSADGILYGLYENAFAGFGKDLAVSGNYIIASTPWIDVPAPTSGRVYVYRATLPSVGKLVVAGPVVATESVEAPTINATNGLIINNNTISANVTIPIGSSAMSVGPITIAPGVTVTVPAGSRHLIL